MKTQLLVCVLICAEITQALGGVVNGIPKESQVILNSADSTVSFFEPIFADHAWTPTAEQTQESLKKIQAFLENSTVENKVTAVFGVGSRARRIWIASEIKKILTKNGGYRVQFWGDMSNGKKVIICNFFPTASAEGDDEFSKWHKQEVSVDDGGYYFWRVVYDPALKAVVNFDLNGYAQNDDLRMAPFFASCALRAPGQQVVRATQ